MLLRIGSPKDFWAGAIYISVGTAAVVLGSEYPFGTGARMGPGYFPTVLGFLLLVFGGISVLRSLARTGERIEPIAWKPLASIIGSALLFGFLLPRLGLIVALVLLVLGGASASERFRVTWKPLFGLLLLVAFCALAFVEGLGLPMPLRGVWLTR